MTLPVIQEQLGHVATWLPGVPVMLAGQVGLLVFGQSTG